MRDLEKYLNNNKIDYNKLIKYGFIKDNNKYIYKIKIHNNEFEVVVDAAVLVGNYGFVLTALKAGQLPCAVKIAVLVEFVARCKD